MLVLFAKIIAYVSIMFDYIDFLGVTNSLSKIPRALLSSSSNTRQVHFDHVFHTYVFIAFSVILATTSPVVILILVVE